MIGVGVGGDFHQAGARHFTDLLPGQELAAWPWQTGEVHRLVQRRIDPGTDRREHCRPVIGAQNRHHAGVEAGITVVEAEHDGLGRQGRPTPARGEDLVHADRLVAVLAQPGQLLDQTLGAHRHHRLVGVGVIDIVVGNAQKMIFRPRRFVGLDRALGGWREWRGLLGAGAGQQYAQDQQTTAEEGHDQALLKTISEVDEQAQIAFAIAVIRAADQAQVGAGFEYVVPANTLAVTDQADTAAGIILLAISPAPTWNC